MRPVFRLFPALLVPALAISLTGCGGGGGGGGNNGPAPVAATYSIDWAARARTTGPSSALSVTFTLVDGQNRTVLTDTRNRNAAPAAYTGTYTTTQKVTPGAYTARFTFHAAANAGGDVVGNGAQTVTLGNGGAVPSIAVAGTVATVEVTPDQQVPVGQTRDLAFTARTAAGQAVAVSAGSAFWTVTSGNQFATAGPNGITGVAGGTAEVTVTVDGKTSLATPINVTVAGTEVTLQVPGRTVLFAAYQDGNGQWIPVETLANTMTARISSAGGKYGFAAAYTNEFGQPEVQIFHATTAETTTVRVPSPFAEFEEGSLQGVLSNLPADHSVSLYGYNTVGYLPENGAYTASMGKKTPWDLITILNKEDENAVQTPLSVSVRRGLNSVPLAGQNLNVNTDFTPVVKNTLTANGAHLDTATLSADLRTANGTVASLAIVSDTTLATPGLPAGLRDAGDRYTYSVNTFSDDWYNQVSQIREVPADVTLTALEPIAPVTVTAEGVGEGVRARADFTTNGAKLYELSFTGTAFYRVYLTPGWLGTTGSAKTYTTPEFFEVPGWDTGWSLGELSAWDVRAYNNNGTIADLFDESSMLRAGYQWNTSDRYGNLGGEFLRKSVNGKARRIGLPGAPIRAKR